MIPEVTSRSWDELVLDESRPVVVWFTADWCQPCKALKPELEAAAVGADNEGLDYKFFKADIEQLDPDILRTNGVQSVPTVMVFERGGTWRVHGRIKPTILEELRN